MTTQRICRIFWMTLVWLLSARSPAGAAESYYLLVFASQNHPVNDPDLAHSFATFVRVTGDAPPTQADRFEAFTISWLPATLQVQTRRLLPEPGVNLDLHASLDLAYRRGLRVSVWGPYQIERRLYEDALARKTQLEGGGMRYKAVDTGYPTDQVSNCIHAITDLALRVPRLRVGTPVWGDPASYFMALAFRQWVIRADHDHDWVLERLDLASRPLTRRRLDEGNPNLGPLQRRVQDALHDRIIAGYRR
jgi:hypothetical protein